jgi:hypothetical protein
MAIGSDLQRGSKIWARVHSEMREPQKTSREILTTFGLTSVGRIFRHYTGTGMKITALNHSTPIDVLEMLSKDRSKTVRNNALFEIERRKNSPEDVPVRSVRQRGEKRIVGMNTDNMKMNEINLRRYIKSIL